MYWLPIGGKPCHSAGDLTYIGEFYTTSASRLTMWRTVRHNSAASGSAPSDLMSSAYDVDFNSAVPRHPEAGQFFLYSRGPIKTDPDGTGTTTWNTNDKTKYGIVVNLDCWDSTPIGFIQQFTPGGTGPQFISGINV